MLKLDVFYDIIDTYRILLALKKENTVVFLIEVRINEEASMLRYLQTAIRP